MIWSALAVTVLCLTSCEKDLETDSDIMAGKWRNAATLNDAALMESSPWKAKDYIEYAPYNPVRAKRTVMEYTYTDDTTCVYLKNGTYTIKEDSLFRVDNTGNERAYKILYVCKDSMSYRDAMDRTTVYYRYR